MRSISSISIVLGQLNFGREWGYIEEHWYWTSLTTRRSFFSLRSRFLTFCKSNFFFIFKFSNFRFFFSSPPSSSLSHSLSPRIHTQLPEKKKTFQNDHHNEQQGHSIQIPLPLHLDTSNRTNHVPLNSTSIAVSAADSRSMILSLENNVNVVSNIIRDSENLVKIKCGQCRKVSDSNFATNLQHQAQFQQNLRGVTSICSGFLKWKRVLNERKKVTEFLVQNLVWKFLKLSESFSTCDVNFRTKMKMFVSFVNYKKTFPLKLKKTAWPWIFCCQLILVLNIFRIFHQDFPLIFIVTFKNFSTFSKKPK